MGKCRLCHQEHEGLCYPWNSVVDWMRDNGMVSDPDEIDKR